MKTLTKIRLINWHYFEDETINIKNNALFTGQNASGKSTIMDAISYVLTAGDQNFNLAANEKGKRDLRSYCKCKLGSLDQEYLRDYDLSTHICLEFYSQKQEKFFCLGVVIDCIGNITQPKSTFYIVNAPMKDEYFVTPDREIKSSSDFKKGGYTDLIFQTRKEAKSAFRNKMGGISEKYFNLLPKALAFKPIADVKDYIYQHLLEEKAIDVVNIQDSIRSYKEFEGILKQTKSKIEDLERITNNYYAIKEIKEDQDFFEYMLKDLKRNDNALKAESKSKEVEKLELELETVTKKIRNIEDEIASEDEKSKIMYASLSQNKDFHASEMYDRDIKKCETDLRYADEKKREYDRKIKEFKDSIEIFKQSEKRMYHVLSQLNFQVQNVSEVDDLLFDLQSAKETVEAKKQEIIGVLSNLETQKAQILLKIQDVYKNLNMLSKNNIPYRPELIDVRRLIEERLNKIYGEKISVHILGEIIDVTDPVWHNAVEVLLGAQRFTLIVEPKYYDDALDFYNEIKQKEVRFNNISLLNTKKIQTFTSFQPNSIASIIETDNKDARCYINYSVGNVIMVENPRDLEKYQAAMTKEGLLYRGYVVRGLNVRINERFIGKTAKESQKEMYEKLGEELKQQFQDVSDKISLNTNMKSNIDALGLSYLVELTKSVKDSITLTEQLTDLKNKKSKISLSSVTELRKDYENILEGIRVLNQRKDTYSMDKGGKQNEITSINEEILALINENKTLSLELETIEKLHVEYVDRSKELFNKGKEEGKSAKEIENYYTKEIQDKLSNLKSIEQGLIHSQVEYTMKYNRPFGTGYDRMKEYLDEQDKLINSELVKYEGKVRESREKAEQLFKEDFLAKLRSYILEAQDEINKINETLEKIQFGRDKYQFVFPKSKEFGAIYDMVINDNDQDTEYSIFDEEFERKYNQELDELFNNLAQDEGNSQGNLTKYTDYRTYMDYDIKVISGGDVFYFSNISKEKSGGEQQIPFYVAILASFVRLFDKAEKNGLDDSVGLIIFDEVFDKMDAQRTVAMMEFIKHLNVQILFACPPQKMESLSRHTDTTVVVFRSDKHASTFIEASK